MERQFNESDMLLETTAGHDMETHGPHYGKKKYPQRTALQYVGSCVLTLILVACGYYAVESVHRSWRYTKEPTGKHDASVPENTQQGYLAAYNEASEEGGGDVPAFVVGNTKYPHIVFMLADDQGWNDIGYQSTDLSACTPHLDMLAADGVKMNAYYTQATCTPSRGALMTGKYPIHLGLQHSTINYEAPWGLPLRERILPELLEQSANYSSHIIGKWHLGHFSEALLPHRRGFDSFFGFYSSAISYVDHVAELGRCADPNCFYDFHDGSRNVDHDVYTTYLVDTRARGLISNHNLNQPMFLYYAIPNPHSPLMIPDDVANRYADILTPMGNTQRRIFAGMTLLLDESARNITLALQAANMWANTIFIFASDNGGAPVVYGAGSNFPLRGKKSSLFEGGVRVHAFIHSPLLPTEKRGTIYHGLFHVTDWLPTIVHGVLGKPEVLSSLGRLDGINQWQAIMGNIETNDTFPRKEILLNIDNLGPTGHDQGYTTAAIIHDNFKLVLNEENYSTWPVPTDDNISHFASMHAIGSFLFDLNDDPIEAVNLYETRPDVVERLTARIATHEVGAMSSEWCSDDILAYGIFRMSGFVRPWINDSSFRHCHSTEIP